MVRDSGIRVVVADRGSASALGEVLAGTSIVLVEEVGGEDGAERLLSRIEIADMLRLDPAAISESAKNSSAIVSEVSESATASAADSSAIAGATPPDRSIHRVNLSCCAIASATASVKV